VEKIQISLLDVEKHLKNLKLSNNITLDFLEAQPYETEYITEDSIGD
jgi:hypothetical protein